MSESSGYIEMVLKTIEFFSNDGKLKAEELQHLLDIAEKDGNIDQNEMSVLVNVISRIKEFELDENMKHKLQEISEKIS